jgi:hypothetical protein
MNAANGPDLIWWITAIDLPALAGLFWMILRTRQDSESALDMLRSTIDATGHQLREALAAYKLEVAKSYASNSWLQAVEGRLTDHLLRIEARLDRPRGDGGDL